jgi:enoyl-CoA hydratase/carnithine racemase
VAFVLGANLNDDSDQRRKGGAGDGLRHVYHPLMFDLRGLDMPIVTAVNGAAAGRGHEFRHDGGYRLRF